MPQQAPTASSGDVGMGSLTGVVGAVRTDEARSAAVGGRGKGRGGQGVWGLVGWVGWVLVVGLMG